MNIVVISIFLTVLWILSMALAVVGGRYSVREEIKEADAKRNSEVHYPVNPDFETGPPGPVGAMGPAGKDGKDGVTPDASTLIVDKDLALSLLEWKAAVEDRLKRVERKSGMRV